ncbi:hypothetical protein [Roseococcus sp. YIM B11640]|uniref:hypothetical protein n=1 Tax=Roseococcus sp. YIM B11640 TaxID=3133973 RepID=UPI003C7E5F7D
MNRRTALLGGLTLLGACRSVDAEETITLNGVVETVDPTAREVLLRGAGGAQSGALVSLIAGQSIRRLGEIRPGDRVTVRYFQALAAQAVTPFSRTSQPFEGVTVDRRETASRPGGEVTRVRRGRITVTAVNPEANSISFVGPNNVPRTVVAGNPEIQAFIRRLRVGDQVDLVYEEALAVSIEPMRG